MSRWLKMSAHENWFVYLASAQHSRVKFSQHVFKLSVQSFAEWWTWGWTWIADFWSGDVVVRLVASVNHSRFTSAWWCQIMRYIHDVWVIGQCLLESVDSSAEHFLDIPRTKRFETAMARRGTAVGPVQVTCTSQRSKPLHGVSSKFQTGGSSLHTSASGMVVRSYSLISENFLI